MSIKIGTANVNGLQDNKKRARMFKYFKEKEYDIIFLQETHSTSSCEKFWTTQWGGQCIYAHGESNARGTAIMMNKKSKIEILNYKIDSEGRWIDAIVKIQEKRLQLVNLYAPNQDDPNFFESIGQLLVGQEIENKVVAGDFNTTLESNDKSDREKHKNCMSSQAIKIIMREQNLIDIWRMQHQEVIEYTWRRNHKARYGSRLDMILISQDMLSATTFSDIEAGYCSDHSFPYIMYEYQAEQKRGPGLWRLNISLLDDQEYCDQIRKLINEEKAKTYQSTTENGTISKCV